MKRRNFIKTVLSGVVAAFVPAISLARESKGCVEKNKIVLENDDVVVWSQRYCQNGWRWQTRTFQNGDDGWVCVNTTDVKDWPHVDQLTQTKIHFHHQVEWFNEIGRNNLRYREWAKDLRTRLQWRQGRKGWHMVLAQNAKV